MAGSVYVNNQKASKAGEQIKGDETIEVRDNGIKYVSRGGLKLIYPSLYLLSEERFFCPLVPQNTTLLSPY